MREIKFRAYLDADKKMYQVISVFKNFPDEQFQRIFITKENGIGDPANYRVGEGVHLMQFTGLHDKNGKEIYEGDIVRIDLYGNTIIIWNDGICSFQYAYHAIGKGTSIDGRMTNTLYDHNSKKYEVVGNLFENPELINSKTEPA